MHIDNNKALAKNKSRSRKYQQDLMASILRSCPHYFDLPFNERMQIRDEFRFKLHKETALCYN